MRTQSKIVAGLALLIAVGLISPVIAAEKQAAKAKAEKVSGDIGLLDTEKNYMIVVTKEGKLVTVDFDKKTKVTKYVPQPAKMSDLNLGEAASVSYKKQGDKNVLDSVEVKVKAKKGE